MVTTVQQIEGLSQRLTKAHQIVTQGKVKPVLGMDNHYVVESSTGDGFYLVNGECTCQDSKQRTELHNGWCKHNLAVELVKDLSSNEVKEEQGEAEDKDKPNEGAKVKDDIESLYGPQNE